jgi:hypothetical protein
LHRHQMVGMRGLLVGWIDATNEGAWRACKRPQ